MFLIQNIAAAPYQKQSVILPSGAAVNFTLYFRSMQQGWFLENISYGTFSLNGVRITNSPNILNQWRNEIPFGLACYSTNNREPGLLQDFSSSASILYILSQDEVDAYTEYLKS